MDFSFCFLADFMRVRPINVATSVTRRMTSTVGMAMAYFRGRKKSCTGCEVSTKGCMTQFERKRAATRCTGARETKKGPGQVKKHMIKAAATAAE